MKITNYSTIYKTKNGKIVGDIMIGNTIIEGFDFGIDDSRYEIQKTNPIFLFNGENHSLFLFKNKVLKIKGANEISKDELIISIKHFVLKQKKDFNKILREIEAFERMDEARISRREKIPDSVKLFVWQRDEGKCVKCGNKEKLEFDHIIPFSMGGGNTERNLELLCESCNRSKGKNITA